MPRRLIRLVLAAALAALVLSGCSTKYIGRGHDGNVQPVELGWHSIDPITVDLPTTDAVDGSPAAPDLTGPLLVNIWASFCAPCRKELPILERLSNTGQLAVVGFTRDTRKASAQDALGKAGVSYANWMDTDGKVASATDGKVPFAQIPSSLLIRDGKVVAVHIGAFKDADEVLAGLEQK